MAKGSVGGLTDYYELVAFLIIFEKFMGKTPLRVEHRAMVDSLRSATHDVILVWFSRRVPDRK